MGRFFLYGGATVAAIAAAWFFFGAKLKALLPPKLRGVIEALEKSALGIWGWLAIAFVAAVLVTGLLFALPGAIIAAFGIKFAIAALVGVGVLAGAGYAMAPKSKLCATLPDGSKGCA